MVDILQAAWPQVLAVIALGIWLLRGEANTKANSSEIRRLWLQRREDKANADRQRHEDLVAAASARDTTNALLDEVRKDIKTLLQRDR
jgi:hypothetical protein